MTFFPSFFVGNVLNNVVFWVCWQVLVQRGYAGVCLLCLMTWENCNCWTSPSLQWAPCVGAALSDFKGCCRQQKHFSQMWALTFWRHSDSPRPTNNLSVEKQNKGNRAPLITLSLCIIFFVLFLPWSLPWPLHSIITRALSVSHVPGPGHGTLGIQ